MYLTSTLAFTAGGTINQNPFEPLSTKTLVLTQGVWMVGYSYLINSVTTGTVTALFGFYGASNTPNYVAVSGVNNLNLTTAIVGVTGSAILSTTGITLFPIAFGNFTGSAQFYGDTVLNLSKQTYAYAIRIA